MNEEMKLRIVPIGEKLEIRHGNASKMLDPFDYQGFQYATDSLSSFVGLVKSKSAGPEKCVVFYNENGYHAILDDTVLDRKQSTVGYSFRKSVQYGEWAEILSKGRCFKIPEFVKFLKRREPDEIEGLEHLLYAAQNFRYVTNISGDFTYDNAQNYIFLVKVNDAEGTIRMPQEIVVTVEIYLGSGWKQAMDVEIEIHRPKNADEEPLIGLSCPKFVRYLEKAKEQQFAELGTQLAGWLVVAGSSTTQR